jgi:hypothetical protein
MHRKRERMAVMRAVNPAYEETIRAFPSNDQAVIASYWKNRPTSLAYEILGGELTATIEHKLL